MRTVCITAVVLATALIVPTAGYSQPESQCRDVGSFFLGLPGDWVGTVSQSTDGKFTDTRYFQASTKQTCLGAYETTFTYYRIDAKTGEPVPAGACTIKTTIDAAGTATNSMTGKGEILVGANTLKPESHEITEVLSICPTGGLQGTANGRVNVSGMPLGLGKNGKVQGYSSTWSMTNDVLKISQRFSVVFVILLCRKSHAIAAEYTATRGTDIVGLMKSVREKIPGG